MGRAEEPGGVRSGGAPQRGGAGYFCQNTKTTITLGTSPFNLLLLSVVGIPSLFR